MDTSDRESGFALITVMLLLALLLALVVAHFTVTGTEMSTTRGTMDDTRGFYAAEAGLNVRAELVRRVFEGYNRPAGASPDPQGVDPPCTGANLGNGDFVCIDYDLERRRAETFVVEPPGNPVAIVIPRGEPFQNLHAQEYRYEIQSTSHGPLDRPEAMLQMRFKSRLVPMFQFVAFYNKDLEILPGPAMNLEGPVHTNGDLYLGTSATLDIRGQVTSAGDIYRGRKDTDMCMAGPVSVIDPDALAALPACAGGRRLLDPAELDPWNGMVLPRIDPLTVPPPEALDPQPGQIYWDRADLRVMLNVDVVPPAVEVRDPDGGLNAADTATLAGCGAVDRSNTFFNNREGSNIQMLEVDARGLLDCLHETLLMGPGKDIDDGSEGGLVLYLGVDGPNADAVNNYGVRVRNGADLSSSDPGAPEIRGLTVVTNQAVYIQGDYNAADKKPASFLADSLNILSNAWDDANSTLSLANRVAASTTVQAAFLAGTDTTGGTEGAGGQDADEYNGGLENYPRFHENWSGRTLTYGGSFVSLNQPRHVDGRWIYGNPYYEAPNRNWSYDTDFNDAANLPPLSPRFVYLRQELFERDYER